MWASQRGAKASGEGRGGQGSPHPVHNSSGDQAGSPLLTLFSSTWVGVLAPSAFHSQRPSWNPLLHPPASALALLCCPVCPSGVGPEFLLWLLNCPRIFASMEPLSHLIGSPQSSSGRERALSCPHGDRLPLCADQAPGLPSAHMWLPGFSQGLQVITKSG